jgi:hypothetical protein
MAIGISAQAKDATEVKIEKLPGYVDLAQIRIPAGAEEVMDIDLGPSLLKIAAKSDPTGDKKLSQALSQIQSIRVKSFSIGQDEAAKVQRHIEEIEKKLSDDEWHRLVHMKDGSEIVSVNAKQDNDKIIGLMIMVFDPSEEATFVNVVGQIDLATIMSLAMGMEDVDLQQLIEEIEGE